MDMQRKKLNKAFVLMRKKGLMAKQNFWCCQSCGVAAFSMEYDKIEGKKPLGYVFYHKQGGERLKEGDPNLCLYYSGFGKDKSKSKEVANLAMDCLREAGLSASWEGDTDRAIEVKDACEINVQKVAGNLYYWSIQAKPRAWAAAGRLNKNGKTDQAIVKVREKIESEYENDYSEADWEKLSEELYLMIDAGLN